MTSRMGAAALQRGRACNTCRKRKIRCDAIRPVCTQCLKSARPGEHCEYNEAGKSRAQVLEDTVAKLQAKIRDLEIQGDANSIKLNHPYAHLPFSSSVSDHSAGSSGRSPTDYPGSPCGSMDDATHNEPNSEINRILLSTFLQHAYSCCFFLDTSQFKKLNDCSVDGDTWVQLLPALKYAILAWGARLSDESKWKVHEGMFLSRCIRSLAVSLAQPASAQQGVQIIQTHVLLTTYYMELDQDLQANVHLSTAVSLVLSYGLNSPNKTALSETAILNHATASQLYFQREEAIRAFWVVFVLNNVTAAQETATSMTFDLHLGVQVDTPWPQDGDSVDPPGSRHSTTLTLHNFWHGISQDSAEEYSKTGILAKASFLYRQAHFLVRQFRCGQLSNDGFASQFAHLDNLLARFRERLPPAQQFSFLKSCDTNITVAGHSLAHAALVELHLPFAETSATSRQKCLSGAESLFSLLCDADLRPPSTIFPFQTSLWATMCNVQVQELTDLRVSRDLWCNEEIEAKEAKIMQVLKEGMSAIAMFSPRNPRSERLLKELQESISLVNPLLATI